MLKMKWRRIVSKKEFAKSSNPTTLQIFQNVGFVLKYLYKVNKKLFYLRFPLLLFDMAITIMSAFFLKVVLNELTTGAEVKTVVLSAVGFAFANFTLSLIKRVFNAYDKLELEKTNYNIKLLLGQAVAKMSYYDIEEPRMRDFISLAESSNSFSTILEYSTGFIVALMNIVTYSSIVIYVQPLILVLMAVVVIIQLLISRMKQKVEYKWREKQAPVFRKLEYFLSVLSDHHFGKEMRVYNLQDYFIDKTNNHFRDECIPILKRGVIGANGLAFLVEFVKVVQKFFIYLFLGIKVVFYGMLIGDFSFYLSISDNLTNYLAGVVGCFSNLMSCGAFAQEFRYCINLSTKNHDKSGQTIPQDTSEYSIEFKNVSFKYPHTENYVLKNVSFKINAGEHLSLVGVNGAGKSTIVKLICGFYKPTKGNVYICGMDSKDICTDEFSRLFAVVFQDFKLFSFSIKENISMNTFANNDKILLSVKKSGLGNKVKKLENGIETFIYKEFDENGVEFSGGEGQKLAISRAIYKDAPMIILDEPTAALDPIAEYEIYKQFDSLATGKTSIYISHRLSSTRFTDKIAVLSEGKLIEYGTHKELISIENGLYKKMFNMQAQHYIQ